MLYPMSSIKQKVTPEKRELLFCKLLLETKQKDDTNKADYIGKGLFVKYYDCHNYVF